MNPADIKDETTLKAWLEGQSREVAITIAHRAAMRVAPVFWKSCPPAEQGFGLEPTALFRRLIIISIFFIRNNREVVLATKEIVFDQLIEFKQHSAPQAVFHAASVLISALLRSGGTNFIIAAVRSTVDASEDLSLGIDNVANIWAVENFHDVGNFWAEIRKDAEKVPTLETPIWSSAHAQVGEPWTSVRRSWAAQDDPGWQFWIDWYDAALEGRPLLDDWECHWKLLTEVALIAPVVWDKGPDAVNPVVALIFQKHDIQRQAAALEAEHDRIRRQVFATQPAPRDHNNPPEILALDPEDFDTVCDAAGTAQDAVAKIGKEAGKQSPDPTVLEQEGNRLWDALQVALRYLGSKADLSIDTLIKWGVPVGMTWLLANQVQIAQLVASLRSLIAAL